jgi:hypothetical protein
MTDPDNINFGIICYWQCPQCKLTWDYPEGLAEHYRETGHSALTLVTDDPVS